MKRYFLGVAAAVLGTVMVGGTAVRADDAVPADPAAPVATAVPTTIELPLFGAPLTLGITTDLGGALTEVSVDSADPTVATKLKPHKVVFKSSSADPNADPAADPARVVVKSGHGGQSVSARAGSLADVSGSGHWTGDVFGVLTTVKFTIGPVSTEDSSPDITAVTTDNSAGVVGDVEHSSNDHEGDGGNGSARVSIKFTNAAGDQSRVLSIRVKVRDHHSETGAQLSISLSPIKGVAVDATTAAGPHTWSGVLCNNSAVSIAYTVAEDGTVTEVTPTPVTADVKTDGDKIWVQFSDHESVFIKVRAKDGMIKISAQAMLHCDSGDPTTNVDVTIPTPDQQDGHHNGFGHGDHRGGGDKGGSHGGA
ncbi:MAG TPA: hypothetical protein VHN36_14980 [Ilumatobacteraceae bacterium]|nr:hypothetical protein [Ilumatobacteraceae bacterium]